MKNNDFFKTGFLFFFVFFFAKPLFAQDYFRINNGNTQQIDKFFPCKIITNNCGTDIFVPTRSQAEWDSFIANAPNGVAVIDCQVEPSLNCSAYDGMGEASCICCDPVNWTGNCNGPVWWCGDGGNKNMLSPNYSGCWYHPTTKDCMIWGGYNDGSRDCISP